MDQKKSTLSLLQKCRIFLVIFLVGMVVFLDREGDQKSKKMAETLFQSISADYEQILTQDFAILKMRLSDWQAPW